MTLTLSVEEMSRDFEAYFKRVEENGETIILTLEDSPVAEICPLPIVAQEPDRER